MSGNNYVADTNILLYILSGNSSVKKYITGNLFISEITEIELLGNKEISEAQYQNRCGIIDNCALLNISGKIKKITIGLKQKYNIKIPDAIIAATSIYLDFPLLTADNDFKRIKELDLILIDPAAK